MSKTKSKLIISLLFIFSFNLSFFGQNDTASVRNDALKIFLGCEYPDYGRCDVDFMKREISFVNYVRDTKEAQVHILITRQNAGNGGKKYDLLFLGQLEFENQNDTLSFVSLPDNTDAEIRDKQLLYLKLGLIKYVSHTKLAELLEIKYTGTKDANNEIVKDKWNSWVFELSSQTYMQGESLYSNFHLWSNIRANRITPDWKLEFRAGNNFSQTKFVIDENVTLTPIRSSYFTNGLIVKSLNEHWSVGGIIRIGNNTYSNYDLYASFYPAIEYNIFPYSKSSVKQFTFRFETGYKYSDYTDSTDYDKMTEHLFESELSAAYKVTKKWGNINTSINGSTLMHDLSKYNIDLYTSLNVRIVKGLSVELSGSSSLIRNQINLPKQGATYEEILLRQQQVSTDYRFSFFAGLSYTFGSIYNNVVNPRFDN